MNPRIYNKAPNKHGVLWTSAHKQRDYRRAAKLGLTCTAYRALQGKQADKLYAFIGIHDYALATHAYKQAMVEIHPDHGGDPASAARVNEAWGKYKKQGGWTHAS
jgi:hypothetical protein